MALWVCGGDDGCGTKYAVGLFRCPRCHNTAFYEDGDPMAKITRHGGASDATLPAPEPEAKAADVPAPGTGDTPAAEPLDVTENPAGPAQPADDEGGEESSPGSSSSASTETPQLKSEPSSKPAQSRARTAGSRSKKGQTDSSSVPSTGGGQTAATSVTGSADE